MPMPQQLTNTPPERNVKPAMINVTVHGMTCSDCATHLQDAIRRVDGVQQCEVQFNTSSLTLSFDPVQVDLSEIRRRAEGLGYKLDLSGPEPSGETSEERQDKRRWIRWDDRTRLAAMAVGLALALILSLGTTSPAATALYLAVIAVGGWPLARQGFNTLRYTRSLDMNALMTIAVVGAVAIGELAEGAMVVFLFSLGEALETYTFDRARQSVRKLMALAPDVATRLHRRENCSEHMGRPLPNGASYAGGPCPWCPPEEEQVRVDDLRPGDHILVRPGERIPMDGAIVSGHSAVNQAPITGESIPVDKGPGQEVFAGTINGQGALEIQVTRLARDNTLSRIIDMVERAQERKARVERWIDRFARYYTPTVVAIAILVAAVPPLLGEPFLDPPGGGHGWLYRALALLVIACPCALVISTPVAVVSAISAAARHGVLIKGGAYLEALARVRAIAFDKTGTLTEGQPRVHSIRCDNGSEACDEACPECRDVLALAAAVEARSEHPLARAVVSQARRRELTGLYPAADDTTALVGRGVEGTIQGRKVTVGSHPFFDAQFPHSERLCDAARSAEADGKTAILIHDGERVRGFLAVADAVRAGVPATLRALRALGISSLVMLSGDNETTAKAVARELGLDEVQAGLLPQDKLDALAQLQERHGTVAMVGDGVNDAPALAAATVGIAMGGIGSDQAMETADVVLMADDLDKLPWAIRLARRARSVITQNIAFSLGLKLIFMALALAGVASLWMAVFADVGASLIVILNGMRLLRHRT